MDLSKYHKSILHIDSRDREKGGSIHDFRVKLDLHRTEIKAVELLQVEIPNVFPAVRENFNNKLYFEDTSGTSRITTIPEGNYTINELMKVIKDRMNGFSNGVFDLSYHSNTFKIKIECDNDFKLFLSNQTNSIWNMLGFTGTTDLTGADYYIADSVFDLSGDHYIYLKSDLVNGCIGDSVMTTNKAVHRSFLACLAKISITTSFGEIQHFQNPTKIIYKVDHKHLSSMNFQLQDNNGNPLEITRDYSISLILYSKPKYVDYNFLSFNNKDKDNENQ
tara:strand:+ start:86 stop:916 length:831 start_codon:yes stop_codon:yes gene_type:complete